VLFGVGVLHVRRPNHAPTLKKGQVDVFSLVFVSADNIKVSARLTTDLLIKNWVGQLHAADPKAAYPSKILPSRFSLAFVSATPPSARGYSLPQKVYTGLGLGRTYTDLPGSGRTCPDWPGSSRTYRIKSDLIGSSRT